MTYEFNTFEDFVKKVGEVHVPELRDGQRAFNVLWACRPDLAEQVRGTAIDPFYRDEMLPSFYEWVGENW